MEDVRVGKTAYRGLPSLGYQEVELDLPFEASRMRPSTPLERAVHMGSQPLDEQLQAATAQEVAGGMGENSILHFVCQFYSGEAPRDEEECECRLCTARGMQHGSQREH